MRILIVDDDRETLEFLESFFTNLGHETILCDNAEDGLKGLVVKQPDLVLLDIMIPGKDGLVLLKEMKELDKEVSIAMITAYKDANKVIESFRMGAMDCLLKPFNLDYVISTVLPRVKIRPKP